MNYLATEIWMMHPPGSCIIIKFKDTLWICKRQYISDIKIEIRGREMYQGYIPFVFYRLFWVSRFLFFFQDVSDVLGSLLQIR